MQPRDESMSPPPPSDRPVPTRSPRARGPEHELRDRAKAAKLRSKAAKARVKANRMTDRARHLNEKAAQWERRADELDSVLSQT
ncbi:MAG TPA: hypothetical protein VEO96_01125 [Thermoplasmata archaeon]|nr:hypothetical protein [Thermoplasmata archaeon]